MRSHAEEQSGDYEMAEAMRTGKPYQTRLDPSPGPSADANKSDDKAANIFSPVRLVRPANENPQRMEARPTWLRGIHPPSAEA